MSQVTYITLRQQPELKEQAALCSIKTGYVSLAEG